MIRTQLSLEASEISWLRREAKTRGTSMAGVVRQLIRSTTAGPTRLKNGKPSISNQSQINRIKQHYPWVGLAKDAPPTDATLVNDYLYGEGEAI